MSDENKPVMGRPRIEFCWEEFRKLCRLQCTKIEIADFFDCSEDTLEKRIKEEYNCTFTAIFKRMSAGGKMSLRRWQMRSAEKGNAALLIFLGKQYLGQSDDPLPELEDEFDYPEPK